MATSLYELVLSLFSGGGSVASTVRGGAKGTTVAADVTSTAIDANHQALDVMIDGRGTAGTAAGGVVSVQGVAGGTPVPMSSAVSGPQTATWDSTTLVNATLPISTEGFTTIGMQYVKTGVITAGAFVIEVSNNNTTWNIINPGTLVGSTVISPYQLALGSVALQAFISGFRYTRIRLSTAITGAGSADFSIMASQGGVKADVVSSSASSVPQTVTWDSTTSLNSTLEINVDRFTTVGVQFEKTGTISTGIITFEVCSNSIWTPISAGAVSGSVTATTGALTSSSDAWQAFVSGFLKFRIRLSTVITNTGTAAFYLMASQGGVKPSPSTIGVVVASGSLTANQGSAGSNGAWITTGIKTPNAAVPGGTNLGTLPAVANAAAPTFTETYLEALSMDLKGRTRVRSEDPRVVGDGVTVTADTGDTIYFAAAAGACYRVWGSADFYWHAASACVIGTNTTPVGAKSPENIVFSAAGANIYVKVVASTSIVTVSLLS